MRVKVTLACTECKQRNYNTVKNKKNILRTVSKSTNTASSARSTRFIRKPSKGELALWQKRRKEKGTSTAFRQRADCGRCPASR